MKLFINLVNTNNPGVKKQLRRIKNPIYKSNDSYKKIKESKVKFNKMRVYKRALEQLHSVKMRRTELFSIFILKHFIILDNGILCLTSIIF